MLHFLVDRDWLRLGCIIFSQYYDTADWIARKLTDTLPDGFEYKWHSACVGNDEVRVVGTNPYQFYIEGQPARQPALELSYVAVPRQKACTSGDDAVFIQEENSMLPRRRTERRSTARRISRRTDRRTRRLRL